MIKKPLVFCSDQCIHNIFRNVPVSDIAAVFQEVFTHEVPSAAYTSEEERTEGFSSSARGQTAKNSKAHEHNDQNDQAQADKENLQSILTAFDMAKTIDMVVSNKYAKLCSRND
jgi:hypothetical protein